MSDEDYNFGGFLVLDLRKWWRHVQPKFPFFAYKKLESTLKIRNIIEIFYWGYLRLMTISQLWIRRHELL